MTASVNNKYSGLRSRLIKRGTNIRRWAIENDYPPSTVYDAIKGNRTGIEAVRIKKELEAFANA